MEGTGCKETHLKGGHVSFVLGEVSGEDEILHQREDFLSLVGWQVSQQSRKRSNTGKGRCNQGIYHNPWEGIQDVFPQNKSSHRLPL